MNNLKPYHNYKPSGIAWLGDIPEHWEVRRLKYLANCFPSNVDKHSRDGERQVRLCNYTDVYKNDFITNNMKLMLATASNEQIEKFKLLPGDVIITKDSETADDIAVPAFVKEELDNVICGYHLSIIRPNFFMDGKYLHRLFLHKKFNTQFEICSNGVTRVGLGVYDLQNAFGICPSIEEQTAVANFLDYKLAKIDRFIFKKKQLIKLLNEQKAGIINHAVTKGIDAHVKMKPSGIEWLGDIPEHWEVRKLKGISKAYGRIGFRGYKTSDLVNTGEGAITISPSNMKYDFMTFQKCTYLSWEKYEESPEIKIFNNDIIMVKTGSTFGKVGIVKDLKEMATINPQLLVLKNISVNPNYLYLLLKSNLVQSQVKTEVIGSTIPTISQTKILNFNLVLPPATEIESILKNIETETAKITTTIQTIEKEITLTQEYRTTLIAEAVTGKIDVRWYEIPLPGLETYEDIEEVLSAIAEDEVDILITDIEE